MIRRLVRALIGLATQKLSQLNLHHFTEILARPLSYVMTNQIKELLGLRLNFFEQADDFRYANFDFHGRFSFV